MAHESDCVRYVRPCNVQYVTATPAGCRDGYGNESMSFDCRFRSLFDHVIDLSGTCVPAGVAQKLADAGKIQYKVTSSNNHSRGGCQN